MVRQIQHNSQISQRNNTISQYNSQQPTATAESANKLRQQPPVEQPSK
jgi:hypothetical protein